VSAAAYARVQFAAIPHYLRLCLWPHPLVFDYGTCLAFSNGRVVFGAAVLIALAAATGWALVRRPAAGFLGTWFLAILAPSSSVIPVATEPMAEHRMYLPLAAVAVAFAVGLHALLGKRCVPVLLALAAALGWATARRNGDYRSEEVLWRTTLAARPGNERARNNLGNVLAASPGRLDDAIAEYREAVRLRPEYAEAHFNLGCALERTPGGLAGAIAAYREAVRLKPDFAEAHNNLGSALERLPGGSAEAMANFEAALRLKPGYAEARNNLGGALLDVPGRLDEATAQFREALRLQPGNPAAHVNLAVALLMANRPGQAREAIASLREALRLDPGNAAARALLEREGQAP
jgi:tetratricopeptide (TPR) repeat protein